MLVHDERDGIWPRANDSATQLGSRRKPYARDDARVRFARLAIKLLYQTSGDTNGDR
jgi:hypothetical protein